MIRDRERVIMLKKETNLKLDNYIKMFRDYDSLTAKKMANDCYVSASTISRYVKGKGFEDFKHFKYHLKNQRRHVTKTEDYGFVNSEWINLLDYNLHNLKQVNFNNLEILKGKKVLVYSDIRYEKVTNIFLEKVQVIHDTFTRIRNRSEMDFQMYKNRGECVFLSIGEIPDEFYTEECMYYEIKYGLENTENYYNNIKTITLLTDNCSQLSAVSQNLSFLYIFLEVLAEEYTRVTLSSADYRVLNGFFI